MWQKKTIKNIHMKNWKKILVVAVHPDDETLGCGATLFRLAKMKKELHWLIVTTSAGSSIFGKKYGEKRKNEIKAINKMYGFATCTELPNETGYMEDMQKVELVQQIIKVVKKIQPDTIFLPFPWDAHKEHQTAFEAAFSATKTFRNPFIERVLVMETLSETDYAPVPLVPAFAPTHFVNVSGFINKKVEALKVYASEVGEYPFPRSEVSVRSLAKYRGGQSGFEDAEAFMCIKERYL